MPRQSSRSSGCRSAGRPSRPTTRRSAPAGGLSAEFRAIFEATRATFLEETAAIGVSHRAVRLRAIERLAYKAEALGNLVLAASLLEQAEKEVGNAFTNKREVAGDAAAAPVRVLVSWCKPQ